MTQAAPALVEKDVLYPGTVCPPDRDGPVEFVSEDLPNGSNDEGTRISVPFVARRLKEMLGAGLQIPVSWAHQTERFNRPLTKAEMERELAGREKLALGHAAAAELDGEGIVQTKLDVPDEDDRRKLPKVRFVSPYLRWNVKDGNGKTWPGPSIVHIAVTARPVQHKQKPFRLGLDGGPRESPLPLCLSLEHYSIRLGDDLVADDNKDKKGGDGNPAADSGGKLKKVLECLARVGLALPEDTTSENLLDMLHASALTKEAAGGGAPPADPDPDPVDPDPAQPNAGIAMSLEKATRPLRERLLATERTGLRDRIRRLFQTTRISRPVRDKLLEDLKTQPLSLSQEGALEPNPLLLKVEAYEALEGNQFGTAPAGLQLGLGEPQPAADAAQDDAAIIEQIAENWGTRPRKK